MKLAAKLENVTREYALKGETVRALRGITLDIPEGDYVAIMGASGSGKSTMLNLLGCLDQPTAGNIRLGDDDVSLLDDDALSTIRATRIGFVFQSYNLIPQLTVLENIEVPLFYQGAVGRESRQRCLDLANEVGLGDRLSHRPTQLSGGQQQRVAIARSLVNDPFFILADEPTGNLDSVTTEDILDLLDRLNAEGRTIILVTHETEVGARAKRIIRLKDGLVISDQRHRKFDGSWLADQIPTETPSGTPQAAGDSNNFIVAESIPESLPELEPTPELAPESPAEEPYFKGFDEFDESNE